MEFSFIDFGNRDFVRDENGDVVTIKADTYNDASNFIAEGGLDDYDWTNEGTRTWCWDEEE